MFNLFRKKSNNMLGVDISSSSVKLIELSRNGHRYQVESYAVEPLPDKAVVENTINNEEAVGLALKRALQRSKSKAKSAAVAVSGSAVITKHIDMSASLNELEMENQVAVEADQHIPYSLEEVAIDFDANTKAAGSDTQQVLLAACRKENVEVRANVLEIAGLTAKVVDVEVFAIERAFELISKQFDIDPQSKIVAIFDIGDSLTALNVMHEGTSIYTREQSFGGKQLTEDIQRRYGMNAREANKVKTQGGLPDDYYTEVLPAFKEATAQQISRSLQFFYSSSQYNTVDYIALAGGTSCTPGINQTISEKLGIPTIICNPFNEMTTASSLDSAQLKQQASSMMIACGLAMRSFV